MPFTAIDTHVHIWDLNQAAYPWLENDTSIINRSFFIEELEAERLLTDVKEGILVQASGNFEDTDNMLAVAAVTDWIKGVVIWLPLLDTQATIDALRKKYAANKYVKGVRHQIHDEKDVQWLLQPAVIESLKLLAQKGLPYDLVGINPEHIETALAVAAQVPDLKMVFDHMNQPPIASGEQFGRWGTLMKRAAAHPNFYMKISGLGTTTGKGNRWSAEDIKPYVAFALEHFGVERCFCGGDWPVALLAGSYADAWKNYTEALLSLLPEQQVQKVLYDNAKLFYQL